ncbi:efflux RND transporter permease subunit [Leptospira yanagawae]|nr:efflux RND transporter permease subunit [Leptospira yanagawae]
MQRISIEIMPFAIIQNYRYQFVSGLAFLVFLSLFYSNQISIEDENQEDEFLQLEISHHWPGKSALQIEGQIAKPWETILKTVNGYRERQFVSDHGILKIYLQMDKVNSLSEFIQTLRNVYILNQNQFPNDVHFPRIQSREDKSSFFIVLEQIGGYDATSEKELELILRNWETVSSVNFQSGMEKEVVVQVNGNDFQTDKLPALSEVFQNLKQSHYGIGKEVESGRISLKTIPNSIDDWRDGVVLQNQKSPEWIRSLLHFQLTDTNQQSAVRVNGESKSTVMVYAKSAFHLLLLEIQLQTLLKVHSHWKIIMVSKQIFIENAKELFFLLLFLDLLSFIFLGLYQKNWLQLSALMIIFYISVLYYLFLSSVFHLTLGNFSFIIILFFKLHLPFSKRLRWKLSGTKLFLVLILLGLSVLVGWVPLLVLKLVIFYGLLLLFSQILFRICDCFCEKHVFPLGRAKEEKILCAFEKWNGKRMKNPKFYQVALSLFVLIFTTLYLLYDAGMSKPIAMEDSFMKYAKLEFPNYISEGEVYRITKQVESKLIDGNWTDLLIVIPKPYRSEFYFKNKLNGLEIPFRKLPTELGYFHLVEGNHADTSQILRFTQNDLAKLESDLMQLVPWLQYKSEISDVVLCFQPSHEGLEFKTNSFYRVFLGHSHQTSIKEDIYTLQPNLLGKFLWNGRLIDIKFQVNHWENLDPYLKQMKKLTLNQTIFDSSIRNYSPVKLLNRFYQINGKPTLELMVKGENINWAKLEFEIHDFLKQTDTHLYERISPSAPVPQYSILLIVLIFGIVSFRKNEILNSFLRIYCLLLVSKLQNTWFEANYIQIVWVLIFILSVELTSRKRNLFRVIFSYPFIFSFIFLLLYPGNVGYLLFSTVCLIMLYAILSLKLKHSLHFLKPKY